MMSQCFVRGISSKSSVNAAAAAATASAPISAIFKSDKLKSETIYRKTLNNGVKVMTVPKNSNRATVGCAIKAGSIDEKYGQRGINHAIRLISQLGSVETSTYKKTRMLQQLGASFKVSQCRDYTFFSVDCEDSSMIEAFPIFFESIMSPHLHHWEIHDLLIPKMVIELNTLSPDTVATEALHKAAYRNQGLGNSLFITENRMGKISSVDLKEYLTQHYTLDNMIFVSVGTDIHCSNDKKEIAPAKQVEASSNKFCSGDVRIDNVGENAFIALATEGVSRGKDAYAGAVLQKILGVGTPTKRGNGAGVLQKAVKTAIGDAPHAVSALNFNYQNSGLIGAYLAVDSSCAGKAVDATVKCLRTLSITDEQVAAAKKRLLIENSDMISDSLSLTESVCVDFLFNTGLYTNATNTPTAAAINSVTTDQVKAVAKKLSGKLAIGATGNLENVPYADSL